MLDRTLLEGVTHHCGVYLFLGSGDQVLYVGKAKKLKERLRSYFSKQGDGRAQIPHLMREAQALKTMVVGNEFEALLLESQLIKLHQPKYNVLLRSDRSHACLHLDLKETWPALEMVRSKDAASKKGEIYGPFVSSFVARELLELVQDLYGLRRCSMEELKKRARPCLWYHIKKCVGPCRLREKEEPEGSSWSWKFASSRAAARGEDPEAFFARYREISLSVDRALKGESRELLMLIEREIARASAQWEYERASKLHQRSRDIEKLLISQSVELPKEKRDGDIFAFGEKEGLVVRLKVRGGRLIDRESFWMRYGEGREKKKEQLFTQEEFCSFLSQLYLGESDVAQEVIVPFDAPLRSQLEGSLALLPSAPRGGVKVFSARRSLRRRWYEIALKNCESVLFARSAFTKRQEGEGAKSKGEELEQPLHVGFGVLETVQDRAMQKGQGRKERLEQLKVRFGLSRVPRRLECFDISHHGGAETVGSCVVYEDLQRSRERTRKYRIDVLVEEKSKEGGRKGAGGDDLFAMQLLLRRRLESLEKEGASVDLWLIDGGRLHLEVAKREAAPKGIDVVAISKEKGKHTRALLKEVIHTQEGKQLLLAPHDEDLLLFQKIRDETHEVAISYQRQVRARKMRRSTLDGVEGIGPKKKKVLLRHFGSVAALKRASVGEICEVEGIHMRDAEAIIRYFGLGAE